MSSPLPTRLNPSNMRTRIRYTILHREETEMHSENFSFLSLRIANRTYEPDLVIDGGELRDRKQMLSKKFRDDFEHTPLSIAEDIPWKCRQLISDTVAYRRLP